MLKLCSIQCEQKESFKKCGTGPSRVDCVGGCGDYVAHRENIQVTWNAFMMFQWTSTMKILFSVMRTAIYDVWLTLFNFSPNLRQTMIRWGVPGWLLSSHDNIPIVWSFYDLQNWGIVAKNCEIKIKWQNCGDHGQVRFVAACGWCVSGGAIRWEKMNVNKFWVNLPFWEQIFSW